MENKVTHSEKLFTKTRKKIVLVIMAVSMLVMLLFSGVVMLTYKFVTFRAVNSELEQYKTVESTVLKSLFESNSVPDLNVPMDTPPQIAPPQGFENFFGGYTDGKALKYVRFIFVNDQLLWSSIDGYYTRSITADLSDIENGVSEFKFRNIDFKGVAVTEKGITIVIARNVEPEYDALLKLSIALVSALVLAFVGVWFVAKFYSKKILAPIREAYRKQILFVQDASHEMRTPLAIIKGKMELISRYPGDEIQEHTKEISDVISEITAMEKMSNHLIMLSKEDAFADHNITQFGLSEMLNKISDDVFSVLAEVQNKEFTFEVMPEDIIVGWDYEKMKRAFIILLDNAFKYTSEGDKIKITATKVRDDEIAITFYDSGRGIRREDLPRIFDRFYRADDVRATDISGSGIGLSMLGLLGSNLGFKIEVSSEYGEFTQFTITAPINMK
ncbi:MAG: HAMP domain-containing histidine kinase [Clostridia bacterium]|nr:HAMP domain-containing histidine kinase [Clostridia bacterium]